MKKKIAILGSTGSIGKTLINIINKDKKSFEVVLLAANTNYKELFKQVKIFNVKNIIIKDEKGFQFLKRKNKNNKIKIYKDFSNLEKILKSKLDYTMSAISGLDGLEPTLKIIKKTKKIAIANKESIICGWNLINKELKKIIQNLFPLTQNIFQFGHWLKIMIIN